MHPPFPFGSVPQTLGRCNPPATAPERLAASSCGDATGKTRPDGIGQRDYCGGSGTQGGWAKRR